MKIIKLLLAVLRGECVGPPDNYTCPSKMTENELIDKQPWPRITRGPLPEDFWMIDLYVTRAMCRRGISVRHAAYEYEQFESHVKGCMSQSDGAKFPALMLAVKLGRTPWVATHDLPNSKQRTSMDLYPADLKAKR